MALLNTTEEVAAELEARHSFLVEAGAGSGKTTTLVRALQHLLDNQRSSLASHGKKIACITYTNVAKNNIRKRVNADPIVDVSTIHEFLWKSIQQYQSHLWDQIKIYSKELGNPEDLDDVAAPEEIVYSNRDSELSEGRISHDDVIRLSLLLAENHPKLIRIIADKYPFIFVDEYQDTSPETIELLLDHLAVTGQQKCVVGLFGDSMQKIYDSGVGEVHRPGLLAEITKYENYRCSPPVVDVLNRIRPELPQIAVGDQQEGEVHLFLNTGIQAGPDRLTAAEKTLEKSGWDWDSCKYLLLTHKKIASTLEYANLLKEYERSPHRREGLTTRNEPYIQYFTRVEGLCSSFHTSDFAELNRLLGEKKSHITHHSHKRAIRESLEKLDSVRMNGTIGDVLDLMSDEHLLSMPGKLKVLERRRNATGLDEQHQRLADFSNNLRNVPYLEVIKALEFIDELTPFSTQHGTKGEEFENVVVVVDDTSWNRYNIGNMIAGTDKNPERTKRSRNLFYVCCSRARKGLAVVFINDIPEKAKATLRDWFASGTIHP